LACILEDRGIYKYWGFEIIMVSMLEAVILSVIQGITEWFPVSSSGHLVLMQTFFDFQNLEFDVFLHFASILAVIVVFWKDIIGLFKRGDWNYIGLLVLAVIPAFLSSSKYLVRTCRRILLVSLACPQLARCSAVVSADASPGSSSTRTFCVSRCR